jgi:hypothetical protein
MNQPRTVLNQAESLEVSQALKSHRPIASVLFWASIAAGAVMAYVLRQRMNVDGVSYLDVASAYARGDWHLAISGYWSPLYCWLLAAFLKLPHTISTEYPLVNFASFTCFVFALWGFHRFWMYFQSPERGPENEGYTLAIAAPAVWLALGYSLFLYLFLQLISVTTPDVLSSGFIFLSAERTLNWARSRQKTIIDAISLALILGLGYLSKAILLYWGAAILAVLFCQNRGRDMKKLVIATVLYLLLCFGWALVLHENFGEFTFGYSGRLNYSWFVNGTPAGELLDPNGTNLPYFPGAQVFNDPPTYEVKVVPNVTYWPWFDPPRIDKSLPIHFNANRQLRPIRMNAVWLRMWFLVEFGAITFSVVALWFVAGMRGLRGVLIHWGLWFAILAIFGMYGLVFIRSFRYIAAFTILLYGLAIGTVRLRRETAIVGSKIVLSAIVMFGLINFPGTLKGMVQIGRRSPVFLEIAEQLKAHGLKPGDKVGVVQGEYSYWARLAQVSVAAEVWPHDTKRFWEGDAGDQIGMYCAMRQIGVTAVVGHPPEDVHPQKIWQEIGQTGYYELHATCSHGSVR